MTMVVSSEVSRIMTPAAGSRRDSVMCLEDWVGRELVPGVVVATTAGLLVAVDSGTLVEDDFKNVQWQDHADKDQHPSSVARDVHSPAAGTTMAVSSPAGDTMSIASTQYYKQPPDAQELRIFSFESLSMLFVVFSTFLTLGSSMSIVGPTLTDLGLMVGSQTKDLYILFVANSIGYVAGSMLSLVTYRLMPKLVCLFISCVGLGLSLISIAFWRSLVYTSLAFGVYGLFIGVMDVGVNTLVFDIWKEKSHFAMQIAYFGDGFGSLITPLISKFFVSREEGSTDAAKDDKPRPYLIPRSKSAQTSPTNSHQTVGVAINGDADGAAVETVKQLMNEEGSASFTSPAAAVVHDGSGDATASSRSSPNISVAAESKPGTFARKRRAVRVSSASWLQIRPKYEAHENKSQGPAGHLSHQKTPPSTSMMLPATGVQVQPGHHHHHPSTAAATTATSSSTNVGWAYALVGLFALVLACEFGAAFLVRNNWGFRFLLAPATPGRTACEKPTPEPVSPDPLTSYTPTSNPASRMATEREYQTAGIQNGSGFHDNMKKYVSAEPGNSTVTVQPVMGYDEQSNASNKRALNNSRDDAQVDEILEDFETVSHRHQQQPPYHLTRRQRRIYRHALTFVGCMFLHTSVALFVAISGFLVTFAENCWMTLTVDEARYLNTAFLAFYSLCRLLTAIAAAHVRSLWVILWNLAVSTVSLVTLACLPYFGPPADVIALWTATCALGVGLANLTPAGLVYLGSFVKIDATVGPFVFLTIGLAPLSLAPIIARRIDANPMFLLYSCLYANLAMVGQILVLAWIGRKLCPVKPQQTTSNNNKDNLQSNQ